MKLYNKTLLASIVILIVPILLVMYNLINNAEEKGNKLLEEQLYSMSEELNSILDREKTKSFIKVKEKLNSSNFLDNLSIKELKDSFDKVEVYSNLNNLNPNKRKKIENTIIFSDFNLFKDKIGVQIKIPLYNRQYKKTSGYVKVIDYIEQEKYLQNFSNSINQKFAFYNLEGKIIISNIYDSYGTKIKKIENLNSLIDSVMNNGKYQFKRNISLEHKLYNVIAVPLKNDNEVFSIALLAINKDSISGTMSILKQGIIKVAIIALILAILLTLLIFNMVVKPIKEIEDFSKQVTEGKLYKHLKLNRKDELGSLTRNINFMVRKLKNNLKEEQKLREQLFEWNQHLDILINKKTKDIRNLLDNAGQGFLSFDKSLFVDKEYSAECRRIFDNDITNKKFHELIFPTNSEQREFLGDILINILETTEEERELYLPLLPDEVLINDKTINLDYKVINSGTTEKVMVILTDITEKIELQCQMEKERKTLKMVVKIVVKYDDFQEMISDYKEFCANLLSRIVSTEKNTSELISELFREVHTFKGNFSQLNMNSLVNNLHNLESEISNLDKHSTADELKTFFTKFNMIEWLEKELAILKEILGSEFFEQDGKLIIDSGKLLELEKKIMKILSPEDAQLLLTEIRKLRYKPLKQILASYNEYVDRLANKLDKTINPLKIEGDNILLDPERYGEVIKSLIHVFRNIMDHGIESSEQRIKANKDIKGTIKCKIKTNQKQIDLIISDDGAGIDIDRIKEKAIEKGIYTQEDMQNISNDELLNIIFKEQFSTKEEISGLSGRGVGLAAVKTELQKVGGDVKVESKIGEGTEFKFSLPTKSTLLNHHSLTNLEVTNILITRAKEYLLTDLQLNSKTCNINKVDNYSKLSLEEFTILIRLDGLISAIVILSVNKSLAKEIVDKFVFGDLTEEEKVKFIEDTLAEVSNIIIGNSIRQFSQDKDSVILGTPIIISSKNALVTYNRSEIITYKLETEYGDLNLSLVTEK